jgi:hypothetical protein
MPIPKLPNMPPIASRIVLIVACLALIVACLALPSATLLSGQTAGPVSEAQSLMNKGQLDKALEPTSTMTAGQISS